jgi:hypothetical protein
VLATLAVGLSLASCIPEDNLEARQAAADRVIAEVLEPAGLGESDVVIYGPVEKLEPGDTVMPVLDLDGHPIDPFVVETDTWFFWIDRDPFARFAHPTQFVFVEGDTIRVEDQQWYAVVKGEELLVPDIAVDDPRRVYGNPIPPSPTSAVRSSPRQTAQRQSPPDLYLNTAELDQVAIVVNGWPGSRNTLRDFQNMSNILRLRGYNVIEVEPSEPGVAGSDMTRTRILEAFAAIAGEREEPYSQFVFYYAGHGSEGSLVMGADKNSPILLAPREIAEAMQPIDALETVLITDACYTGALITQFQSIWKELLKETNRTIAFYSAATATQPSYSDFPYGIGGAFTNALVERITGRYGPGEFIPFATHGYNFQIGTIGGFLAQSPRWDYVSQCSTRGITDQIRFNAMLTNGNTNCGQPAAGVALLIMDWGIDGSMTLQAGEIGTETTGTMMENGNFLTTWDGPGELYLRYEAFIDDDICGGLGTFLMRDAVGCETSYDLNFSKQPWPDPPE